MENKGPREEIPGPLGPLVSWPTEATMDGNEILTMVPFLEGEDGNAPLNEVLSHKDAKYDNQPCARCYPR